MARTLYKLNDKNRERLNTFANYVLYGSIAFAIIGGLIAMPLVAYAAVILSAVGIGLFGKGLANPPKSKARSFVFLAEVAAAITITAALLFAFPPSVGLLAGIVAVLSVSGLEAARFLAKPQNNLSKRDLPTFAKVGFGVTGLLFIGLAVSFALLAAGVIPLSPVALAVLGSCAVGTALTSSLINDLVQVPAAYVPGTVVGAVPVPVKIAADSQVTTAVSKPGLKSPAAAPAPALVTQTTQVHKEEQQSLLRPTHSPTSRR